MSRIPHVFESCHLPTKNSYSTDFPAFQSERVSKGDILLHENSSEQAQEQAMEQAMEHEQSNRHENPEL